jgi:hypothetical protein
MHAYEMSYKCQLYPVQLVAKKTGSENFPNNVNLILSICQLIVYLTIPTK